MKKIIMFLALGICSLVGIVYASSVSTMDGKMFLVTNDAGFTWQMTNAAIMQKINQFNRQVIFDGANTGSDEESLIIWESVEQMAINADTQAGIKNQ